MIVLAGCDAAVREAAFAALAGRPASWFISNDAGDVARLASTVPIVAAVVSDDGAGGGATSLCVALKRARPAPSILYAQRRGGMPAADDALDAGADELFDFADGGSARFGQLLRALAEPTSPAAARPSKVALDCDADSRSLMVDGRAVALTACEYRLFTILRDRAGGVVSYAELQREALGLVPRDDRRTLHVHVCHLRNKLGHAMTLHNRRGVGYRLTYSITG